MMIGQVRWLGALRDLPPACASGVYPSGAMFEGRLEGAPRRTPLDRAAVLWIGIVTESSRHGKSSTITERCRLGSLDGVRLAGDGWSAPVLAPPVSAIDFGGSFLNRRSERPRYWIGAPETVSSIPAALVDRCKLDRQALARNKWTYIERRAEAGTFVAIAGCGGPNGVAPCRSGVAAGHLWLGGRSVLIRDLADGAMLTAAGLTLLMSFFTIVAGIGAAWSLRRAANGRGVALS